MFKLYRKPALICHVVVLLFLAGCGEDENRQAPARPSEPQFPNIDRILDRLATLAEDGDCSNANQIGHALADLKREAAGVAGATEAVRSVMKSGREVLRDCRERQRLRREANELRRQADELDQLGEP